MKNEKNITIFCGARLGNNEKLLFEVVLLARLLSQNGFNLVYGGSKNGIMGKVADEFIRNQREVVGVRYEMQVGETFHPRLTRIYIEENLSERKLKLIQLSNIILILSGGFGTMDELFEVLAQYKRFEPKKLIIIFNSSDYFKHLKLFFEDMYCYKFIKLKDKNAVSFCDSVEEIVELCQNFEKVQLKKYIFLDDVREKPNDDFIHLRNYSEFLDFIVEFGLPEYISFDHDLGEEKSGYDCAKFLVNYCLDHNLKLPEFFVHSQNPVGKENIEKLLENFNKQNTK